MSFSPLLLVLGAASLVVALPSGGSGGSRGGSSGGSRGGSKGGSSGGSSGGSKSSSGGSSSSSSGYRSSNYHSGSGKPLSPGGKIALIVVFSILGAVILAVIIWIVVIKLRKRRREREIQDALMPEKQTLASSGRTSLDEPSNLSYNPGHTQAAVHTVYNPTSNAEMTSAVMAGEGSKAGHGEEGAGDGSRGGGVPVVWDTRALDAISRGMSNEAHHQGHSVPECDSTADKPLASLSMPVPNPT